MRRLALSLACLVGVAGLVGLLAWTDGVRLRAYDASVAYTDQSGASDAYAHTPFGIRSTDSRSGSRWRPTRTASIVTQTVTLSTYPYARCLLPPQIGAAGVRYQPLNWDCLNTAGPPISQTYTLLVLSNDYLTVTLLPDLGGRVYEIIFKPTGHNVLYRNPVVKPAPFGPPEQGWWLAVGGLEWGFPTDEHGYEWGIPWRYQIVSDTAGVTVTVQDSADVSRPFVSVAVHLPADEAALYVRPQIVNPTAEQVAVKYWTNGMLAPGAGNSPSADLRFLFHGDHVMVHSTGDPRLPPAGGLMGWPVHNGVDFSRLGNWNQWLGFFEAPHGHGPYAGVYDTAADEGVVRVYPAAAARGSKGFAFGWNNPLPSNLWTDDGSTYVEVHGGLAPTFWDTIPLSPGQVVSWTEIWYPLSGLGGVTAAGEAAALRLERVDRGLALGLYTPAVHRDVDLYLWDADCVTLGHWQLPRVGPKHPVAITLLDAELPPAGLSLVAVSADGQLLGGVETRDCVPPTATIEALPLYVTTLAFSVHWHGSDAWSGIAGYDVQYRVGYTGAWTDWLTGTPQVSAVFNGNHGRTYFFRVRAYDQMGNVMAFGSEEWGQAFTSVLLRPRPVLITSRKTATPLVVSLGAPVSFTILVSNTGNLTASRLVVTDFLPATLEQVNATFTAIGGGLPDAMGRVITWRGSLSPGHELRWNYALRATSETSVGVPLTNTMMAVGDGLEPVVRRAVVVFHLDTFLPLTTKDWVK